MLNKKFNSIKAELFFKLSILIIITLLITDLIAFLFTRHEIQELFDANLIKSSKLILNLTKDEAEEGNVVNFNLDDDKEIFHQYEHKLHYQIWKGEELIYNSDGNIIVSKPIKSGFDDYLINDKRWRGFAFYDAEDDIMVVSLEKHGVRSDLIRKILTSLIIFLSISVVPITFIIWNVINKKFSSVDDLLKRIREISVKKLLPISEIDLPLEVRPFVDSLNSLLGKLNESLESERRFTDYAAHELRTPLAAIKTRTQLLLKNNNKDREEEFFNDLIKSVDRATHLVNQLFILARLEAENQKLINENINLKEITETIIKNYQEVLTSKGLAININASENLIVLSNKIYIEIMLSNLVDNAIKYSSKNQPINIDIAKEGKSIIFKITNQGEKISDEQIKNIFDKFYRIATKDSVGCGLGLAIVKKIAELHNIEIQFRSESLGNVVEVKFVDVFI